MNAATRFRLSDSKEGKKAQTPFPTPIHPSEGLPCSKAAPLRLNASSVTQAARSGMTDLPRSQRKTFRPPQQQTRAALPRGRAPATPRTLSMFQGQTTVSRPYRTLLWAATADSPAFRQKKQAMPVIEQQRMRLGKTRRTPRRNLQHGVQTHCSRSPCAPS